MGKVCSRICSTFSCLVSSESSGNLTDPLLIRMEPLITSLVDLSKADGASDSFIARNTFIRVLFNNQPNFGSQIFDYLTNSTRSSRNPPQFISKHDFRINTMKMLQPISSEAQCFRYLSMYADDNGVMVRERFTKFLSLVYQITLDSNSVAQHECLEENATLQCILDSVYEISETPNVERVVQWLESNCPRLIGILNTYVHSRFSHSNARTSVSSTADSTYGRLSIDNMFNLNLGRTVPYSRLWLMSTLLPDSYTYQEDRSAQLSYSITSTIYNAYLASTYRIPCHWNLIYCNITHGTSMNRFVFHLVGYKAPTVMFLKCENSIEFCVCVNVPWRESTLLWGDKFSYLLKLSPVYYVIDQGRNSVYMNCSNRGFPVGIRVGAHHTKPHLSVDGSLAKLTFHDVTYVLDNIEVWGCGAREMHELLLQNKSSHVSITPSTHLESDIDRHLIDLLRHK